MLPELEEYRRQFHAIEQEAAALVAGLNEHQLAWRERPGRWSIADCLNHLVGVWFVRFMDAPASIRLRSPAAYLPPLNRPVAEICARFFRLQIELVEATEEVDGLDLARVKVPNPVSNWFRMSLGQELALTAAHERRHVQQASRVRQQIEGGQDVFASRH